MHKNVRILKKTNHQNGQTNEICALSNANSGPSVATTTEKKGVLKCRSTE